MKILMTRSFQTLLHLKDKNIIIKEAIWWVMEEGTNSNMIGWIQVLDLNLYLYNKLTIYIDDLLHHLYQQWLINKANSLILLLIGKIYSKINLFNILNIWKIQIINPFNRIALTVKIKIDPILLLYQLTKMIKLKGKNNLIQ